MKNKTKHIFESQPSSLSKSENVVAGLYSFQGLEFLYPDKTRKRDIFRHLTSLIICKQESNYYV